MTRYRNGKQIPEGWLRTADAALIAGRCQRTIVSWIHAGHLPALKMPGPKGPYLINKVDLGNTIRKLMTPRPYKPKD